MTPSRRKRFVRKRRGTSWTPETSKRANDARWKEYRRQQDATEPARIRALEEIARLNLPRNQGDIRGILQWTDTGTGQVRRWIVRIGDRADRCTVEKPGGIGRTLSHGWTWILDKLRPHLAKANSIA